MHNLFLTGLIGAQLRQLLSSNSQDMKMQDMGCQRSEQEVVSMLEQDVCSIVTLCVS
jgi:hypothetical protein